MSVATSAAGHRRRHPGRRPELAEDLAQHPAPLAGGHARLGAGDGGRHQVGVGLAASRSSPQRGLDRGRVAVRPPGPDGLDRPGLDGRVHQLDRRRALDLQRARLGGLEPVDPDHHVLAGLHPPAPLRQRGDQLTLHVAGLHRGHRAAHLGHPVDLGSRLGHQGGDLRLDDGAAGEQVLVLQQVGLVGQHLLHAQRPLLVPRPGQPECLVPGRQLHRPGPGVPGQCDREHLQHDPLHVVLRLRLGQPERVDLHPVAEPALLRVPNAVALRGDLRPRAGPAPASCTSPRRSAVRR